MTNFEKIKNMNVEELASFILWQGAECDDCCANELCGRVNGVGFEDTCHKTIKAWLESECENDVSV